MWYHGVLQHAVTPRRVEVSRWGPSVLGEDRWARRNHLPTEHCPTPSGGHRGAPPHDRVAAARGGGGPSGASRHAAWLHGAAGDGAAVLQHAVCRGLRGRARRVVVGVRLQPSRRPSRRPTRRPTRQPAHHRSCSRQVRRPSSRVRTDVGRDGCNVALQCCSFARGRRPPPRPYPTAVPDGCAPARQRSCSRNSRYPSSRVMTGVGRCGCMHPPSAVLMLLYPCWTVLEAAAVHHRCCSGDACTCRGCSGDLGNGTPPLSPSLPSFLVTSIITVLSIVLVTFPSSLSSSLPSSLQFSLSSSLPSSLPSSIPSLVPSSFLGVVVIPLVTVITVTRSFPRYPPLRHPRYPHPPRYQPSLVIIFVPRLATAPQYTSSYSSLPPSIPSGRHPAPSRCAAGCSLRTARS